MLAETLKVLLATSYGFAIKSQNFHWNVEGPDFPQYHEFFGKIYEDVSDNAIDQLAEYIRILGGYTPGSFTRLMELCEIDDQLLIPRAELMMAELYQDNEKLLAMLKEAFHVADEADEQSICEFISGRIDAHGKWGWQLRSILTKARA
jgi:starvation-inducible DNA-binding protein